MSRSGPADEAPLRLGISSCLLGQPVRYDGGHKRDRFATDLLGNFVEWLPVCPELESGMGVPRPAMRLVRDGDSVRMLEIASARDHTPRMESYAARRVRKLRENFIERVFAYRRLRDLFRGRWTHGRVVAFHTAHKLQLMAHSTVAYRELGRVVASVKELPRDDFRERYQAEFMAALAKLASRGRNANVLQHAAGHLKKRIDSGARTELAELIHDYRRELVPLVVPVTLIRHHVRALDIGYLSGQTFLNPHPKELMLRNHV